MDILVVVVIVKRILCGQEERHDLMFVVRTVKDCCPEVSLDRCEARELNFWRGLVVVMATFKFSEHEDVDLVLIC